MRQFSVFSDASLGAMVDTIRHRDQQSQEPDRRDLRRRRLLKLCSLALVGLSIVLFGYNLPHLTLFLRGYHPLDRVASFFLLISGCYITIQSLGYHLQYLRSMSAPNISRKTRLAMLEAPTIAIYIATYNEPIEIIEATIIAVTLLDYPNKVIYVNCDHQSAVQAEAVATLARRHNINFIHRSPNTGFKAGGINDFLQRLGEDLPDATMLCIFDADSIPMPTFLREIIPYFQDDSRLAFVQAPQNYGNRDASAVADAAGNQQFVFANYVSEGKQQAQAMFFCGTNVVFRVDALRDIGGLLTTSVTEDFATSMKLHARGWRSQYCNSSFVTGIGPTTLQAYWTQQGRWALGNLETFLDCARDIFLKRGFTLGQRWEYFISGTYYFTGLNTMTIMLGPALFLLFGMQPLVISPWFYLAAFVPQLGLANWFFYASMQHRGYGVGNLFNANCLLFNTFHVFTASAIAALLRRKRPFAVTPKTQGSVLPWKNLWPHLSMMAMMNASIVAGCLRFHSTPQLSILINILWCCYNLFLLTTIFYFNHAEHTHQRESLVKFSA